MSTVAAAREHRRREVRRVLVLTFMANLAVVLAKALAGWQAQALSVLADAAHSSVDAWNNIMALVLARVAAKAPDAEHPYGHAKFETLGALGIVAFLSVIVYELVSGAINRLLGGGTHAEATPFAMIVMATSAAISYLVAKYEDRKGHQYHSELLLADAAHTRSDVYASIAVLGGIGLVAAGYPQADPIFTMLVAIVIARAAWRILQRSIPILVDQRAVEEGYITQVALDTTGVLDCFAVRSRGRTNEIFAELTITVVPTLNVAEAHLIADTVERRVAEAVGAREVVVHVEPHFPERAYSARSP